MKKKDQTQISAAIILKKFQARNIQSPLKFKQLKCFIEVNKVTVVKVSVFVFVFGFFSADQIILESEVNQMYLLNRIKNFRLVNPMITTAKKNHVKYAQQFVWKQKFVVQRVLCSHSPVEIFLHVCSLQEPLCGDIYHTQYLLLFQYLGNSGKFFRCDKHRVHPLFLFYLIFQTSDTDIEKKRLLQQQELFLASQHYLQKQTDSL